MTKTKNRYINMDKMKCVDIGTTIDGDEEKYIDFMCEHLKAKKIVLTKTTTNSDGLTIQHFNVYGNIGVVAIARFKMRLNGWYVMWKQDAIDNGYFD